MDGQIASPFDASFLTTVDERTNGSRSVISRPFISPHSVGSLSISVPHFNSLHCSASERPPAATNTSARASLTDRPTLSCFEIGRNEGKTAMTMTTKILLCFLTLLMSDVIDVRWVTSAWSMTIALHFSDVRFTDHFKFKHLKIWNKHECYCITKFFSSKKIRKSKILSGIRAYII